MQTMAIKSVIFDLDGTITEPILDFGAIRAEMGLTQEDGPILEAMEKMPADERKRTADILDRHEREAVENSTLNDGAKETLLALKRHRIYIGILTRNRRKNALAITKLHNLPFDAIVDREDGPVKPDAFGVLRLCEEFGTAPADTLVVGDFLYDLLSAKAAGAVAVLLRNHKRADEFREHADFTIDKLDEVLKIVERNTEV